MVSARVEEAARLSPSRRAAQRRSLAEQAALPAGALDLVRSIRVRGRRYDVWRHVEVLKGARADPALQAVPLQTYATCVEAGDAAYERIDPGPPFPVLGLEKLPPERAAEQLAVFDCFAFDRRQKELDPYRRRAAAEPASPARLYELALMIWYQDFVGSPGRVAEAEPPLQRALQLQPRAAASQGLLGEVRLHGGRAPEAASAFAEAARLLPGHPRFHYCASVAYEIAGDVAAAKRALARARRVAGPKLRARFTSASNRIRRSKLPRDLRPLARLAERWGVGDDVSRGYLLRRATSREKQQLRRMHARYAQRISQWLDTQLPERPTPETGAFLYLLEACEEIL